MKKQKRVLVCPLDWGLGHATRCIPIVRELSLQGFDVMIASSGDALRLMQIEFPSLRSFALTGYEPRYSKNMLAFSMLFQLPKFNRTIHREHAETEALVRTHGIDIIISDNRYGCWSDSVPSIIVTHQLNIQTPFFQGLVRMMNYAALRRFSMIWVPDFEGKDSLSGALSWHKKLTVKYVGPLSRFKSHSEKIEASMRYDVVAILSGPEPQRAMLESMLRPQLKRSGLKTLLVKGIPGIAEEKLKPDATEADHLSSDSLNKIMMNAELIVCRPGYSMIMDLSTIGGKAVLIPTPGQTEQMYLGDLLMTRKICLSVRQKNFNLNESMKASKAYKGFSSMPKTDLLTDAIHSLAS